MPGTATPAPTTTAPQSTSASSSAPTLAMVAVTSRCRRAPAAVDAVQAGQDRSAEPDPGHGQVGDADVDGEHLHAFGLRRHDVGRAPAAARRAVDATRSARPGSSRTSPAATSSPVRSPIVLRLSPRTAVSSAARGRAVHVDVAQQGGEVAAPDVLGPRPTRTPGEDRHERVATPARRPRPAAGTARPRRRRAAGRHR